MIELVFRFINHFTDQAVKTYMNFLISNFFISYQFKEILTTAYCKMFNFTHYYNEKSKKYQISDISKIDV